MAELKTIPTRASVDKFLKGIQDERQREDCYRILDMMKRAARAEPRMWGTSIIGFGKYRSGNGSGRACDWFLTGFSPRKQNLVLYLRNGSDQLRDLMKQLGKYSPGKDCIYITRLEDVDTRILRKLIAQSVRLAGKTGR